MKIELVEALPLLEAPYRNIIKRMITEKKITLKEWNSKYKNYRDECGYSIIHYFEAYFSGVEVFLTINPIMIENREELQKIFNVLIMTPEEFMKEKENE